MAAETKAGNYHFCHTLQKYPRRLVGSECWVIGREWRWEVEQGNRYKSLKSLQAQKHVSSKPQRVDREVDETLYVSSTDNYPTAGVWILI